MFAFSFPFYTQGNGLVNACQIPMLVNGKTLFFFFLAVPYVGS